jgi:hypothetical protein
LKGIFGIVAAVQEQLADAEDHSPVPLQQLVEGCFVLALYEPLQQFAVANFVVGSAGDLANVAKDVYEQCA